MICHPERSEGSEILREAFPELKDEILRGACPELNDEILRGVYPETDEEILHFVQNDARRTQNDI
jgi:hypothetical protein